MGKLTPSHIPPEIVAVCRRLHEAGHQAYLVGGAVRDHLRLPDGEANAKDFDIATSARPEAVIALFGKRNTVPTGLQHGTVTVLVARSSAAFWAQRPRGDREHVEVTTFRGEGGYSDGRRPDQVFYIDDLTEDLRRRDFTINAIAYDPIRDQLFDPYHGQEDLRERLIRAVGHAEARFAEDGLRTMRAVRFAAQLGFRIDDQTLAAIPSALLTFRKVSGERVRDELLKLLEGKETARGLELMLQGGLLKEVLPELCAAAPDALASGGLFRMVEGMPREGMLRLLALLSPLRGAEPAMPGAVEQMLDRLKLSARERERLAVFLRAGKISYDPAWTRAQVRRFLATTPAGFLADLEAVLRTELLAAGREAEIDASAGLLDLFRRAAEERAEGPALSMGQLALGGGEVMQILGIGKGPMVGVVLRRLLDRVLDEPELNTKECLASLLPRVHEEAQAGYP